MKAFTCYRPTAVADILVNRGFSRFKVCCFLQNNYREMNGLADNRAIVFEFILNFTG